MKPLCPICGNVIPVELVNVQEGIGHCTRCNEVFALDVLMRNKGDIAYRTEKPAYSLIESFYDKDSMGFIIPALGLKGTTFFFLFFAAFWNAISWFMFIMALHDGEVFAVLFMLIFIVIGAGVFGMFIFYWKGVVSFEMDTLNCHVVWSVFKFRRMKTIACLDITAVTEDVVYSKNYQPVYGVCLKHGKKSLKFGSSMTDEERKWAIGEIKQFLVSHDYKLT